MYSNSLVCSILKYINENINNKITIDDLEKHIHYNRYYVMKLFKQELDITIIDYINKTRVYNSLLEIKNTNNSILNIAYKNAFYSIEYYSETFKKIVGLKPQIVKSYYRNNKRISNIEIDILNTSITSLFNLKEKITKYLNNEKKEYITPKVLSIFTK